MSEQRHAISVRGVEAELERRILAAAQRLRQRGATAVYVFGSVLTGHIRPDSDVDLAVEGLPPSVFFRAMSEASRIIGRPVDILDLDRGDTIAAHVLDSGELNRVA